MPVTGDKVTGVREVFDAPFGVAKINLSAGGSAASRMRTPTPSRLRRGEFSGNLQQGRKNCGLASLPNGGRRSASLALVSFCCPTGARGAQALAEKSLRRINQGHTRAARTGLRWSESRAKSPAQEADGTRRKEKGMSLQRGRRPALTAEARTRCAASPVPPPPGPHASGTPRTLHGRPRRLPELQKPAKPASRIPTSTY